LATNNS